MDNKAPSKEETNAKYRPRPGHMRSLYENWHECHGTRDAPDSGFYYPAGYRISRIVKKLSGRIIRPDSGHVKPNMPGVYLSINAPF